MVKYAPADSGHEHRNSLALNMLSGQQRLLSRPSSALPVSCKLQLIERNCEKSGPCDGKRRYARGRQANGILCKPVPILLFGLLLNAFFGLWWADPLATLIKFPIVAREGIDGVRGRACSDC